MRAFKNAALAVLALAATGALSSCATATAALWSEDRLAGAAAARYGVDPAAVRISDTVPTASGTWFTVHLPNGQTHRCFHDGNMMGAGVFSNGVRCGAEADRMPF